MPAVKTLQVTVTGTAGPGNALTSAVFTNLRSFKVDIDNMLELIDNNGKVTNVSIAAAATLVTTITGGNYVVVVAN
jgi:hypothetical protein